MGSDRRVYQIIVSCAQCREQPTRSEAVRATLCPHGARGLIHWREADDDEAAWIKVGPGEPQAAVAAETRRNQRAPLPILRIVYPLGIISGILVGLVALFVGEVFQANTLFLLAMIAAQVAPAHLPNTLAELESTDAD